MSVIQIPSKNIYELDIDKIPTKQFNGIRVAQKTVKKTQKTFFKYSQKLFEDMGAYKSDDLQNPNKLIWFRKAYENIPNYFLSTLDNTNNYGEPTHTTHIQIPITISSENDIFDLQNVRFSITLSVLYSTFKEMSDISQYPDLWSNADYTRYDYPYGVEYLRVDLNELTYKSATVFEDFEQEAHIKIEPKKGTDAPLDFRATKFEINLAIPLECVVETVIVDPITGENFDREAIIITDVSIEVFGDVFFEEGETNPSVGTMPFLQLETNELFNDKSIIDEKTSASRLISISKSYINGKEIIKLRCSISEYKDEEGNVVISTKNADKMCFEIGDVVNPMYFTSDGTDAPMLPDKTFEVIGVDFIYDGAVFQEILAQEM